MRVFGALLAATSMAAAQPAWAQDADAPDLLIVLSVDQLSSDLYEEYAPLFTGGLKRVNEGTVFINGYQAQLATETCPGHSTLLTGAYPARSGIVGNNWIDLEATRDNKIIYCAEDENAEPAEGERYRVSAEHLLVQTLGTKMKYANPATRNVAVAGKDRSAVMMGGRYPDQRWFWSSAGWKTDLDAQAPQSVAAATQTTLAMIEQGVPALTYPAYCEAKSRAVSVNESEMTVGDGRLEIPAGNARAFQTSPAYDGAVLALAAALVQEMGLGRGTTTDLLSIGLSATDYVGHAYGDGGGEMCLQMFGLDQNLGAFFSTLDGWGIDYSVVLTSDHGVMDVPDRLNEKGVEEAQWLDPGLSAQAINDAVAPTIGLSGTFLFGFNIGDLHVAPALEGDLREKAIMASKKAYEEHPQVEAVFTNEELAALPIPGGDPTGWSLIERVRASFHPDRSGDLVVVAKRYVQPIAEPDMGYVATHGSPWDYDRRVPIIFWRPDVDGDTREESAATVDIMPTLAAQIGLAIDDEIDGKCLENVAGIACN